LTALSTIGATITTSDYVMTGVASTDTLTESLRGGHTIGHALHKHYAECQLSLFHPLFVFGDPSLRPYQARNTRTPRLSIKRNSTTVPETDSTLLPLTEAHWMLRVIESCPDNARTSAYTSASMKLRQLTESMGNTQHTPLVLPDEIRSAVIDHMIDRRWARWIDDWWQFAAKVTVVVPGTTCPRCCAESRTWYVAFRSSAVAARRLSVCARCGPIEDLPAHSDLRLVVEASGRCRLSGRLPNTNWSAVIAIFSDLDSDKCVVQWPGTPEGSPATTLTPSAPFPAGPLRIVYYMVSDSWYQFTQVYRPHPDTAKVDADAYNSVALA
jgi:hypothetical protein